MGFFLPPIPALPSLLPLFKQRSSAHSSPNRPAPHLQRRGGRPRGGLVRRTRHPGPPSRLATALLWLLTLLAPHLLRAQPTTPYADPQGRYHLRHPRAWGTRRVLALTLSPPGPAPAVTVTVSTQAAARNPLATDSLWRDIRRLAQAQVLRLEQPGTEAELRYEYTYAPAPPARVRVVGRWLWRGGTAYRIECRGEARAGGRAEDEGREIVASFDLADPPAAPRYQEPGCDNKMYGIAAVRYHHGEWEDDCRTLHEFNSNDLRQAPTVHSRVLPFQSYALAKGFDNCLYAVTKSPTDAPERVYRYNPATRQGSYPGWVLPAQGPDNVWISAATDGAGALYFLTSDSELMVRVHPRDGLVTTVWRSDPLRKTSFYRAIAFAHAGTHGNFCIDPARTAYLVYSTDGALLKVDLNTNQPLPDLTPLDGLPRRGGYSDVLLQHDEAGRPRLYLAGPKALYQVDLVKHRATRVRAGIYTDLAGCNVFPPPPRPGADSAAAPAAPALSTTAVWRGRVLDAVTFQPLPLAQLRLAAGAGERAVPLAAQGTFAVRGIPGHTYGLRGQLAGYLAADTAWLAAPGAAVRDVLLRPIAVGTTLSLASVQFAQGEAVLLPTSFPALDQLVRLLADTPRLTIELRGHTDNVGPPEKNLVLSEQRIAAVKQYLVSHGIADGRIAGIGFGGTQPIAPNGQASTRKLNRRVEFRITGTE